MKREYAFSLVELVIALSILGVGLIGAMRVFPVGLKASQKAEFLSRAAFIGQQALEPLKVAAWDQLKDGETRRELKPFTIVTTISPAEPEHITDPSKLKQVEVSVEWEQEGKLRTLNFVTYLRRQAT